MRTLRIGGGAGFADDRIQYGIDLVNYGELDYIVFECLAERTIAEAIKAKLGNPKAGYNKWLEYRVEPIIKKAKEKNIKIVSNMGAANPTAAAAKIAEIAAEQGIKGYKVAAVTGDDVFDKVLEMNPVMLEENRRVSELGRENIVAANAYLGAGPIVEALAQGADFVVTGRVADPALFAAPIIHEFNISFNDWDFLGKATSAGHLMECGSYVTGAFFADPGVKDIEGLDNISPPICEFSSDGVFVITKIPHTGGKVDIQTCSEQLIYEIHNPAEYITPDVVADFSRVCLEETGKDRVRVTGASGKPKTDTLKVAVAHRDSTVIAGEVSYCGVSCLERAQLTGDVIAKRLKRFNFPITESKIDIIGYNSVLPEDFYPNRVIPNDVRLRVVVRTETDDERIKALIANEIRAVVGHNGAGAYGGSTLSIQEIVAIKSALLPREAVKPAIHFKEV